jgi:glycogen debranching enzyme
MRVRKNTDQVRQEARRRFIDPLVAHVWAAGLGHVSEIADAEPPFTARGCPFQAWSLGELLRASRLIDSGVGHVPLGEKKSRRRSVDLRPSDVRAPQVA